MSELRNQQLQAVAEQAHDIYQGNIQKLAQSYHFSPEPTGTEINQKPLVLVIGNHSSGKSSFINLLLDDEVQRTSLAPMDDGFTILSYNHEAKDVDGSAVVSNSDWPFAGLQEFGPTLVSHLVMKQRKAKLLHTITLVDSPGMIDARVDPKRDDYDRGYDFVGVVRWFAEHADVILLFFDPDNPGTTGETLKVLKDALHDLGHKLELIMNKVDRFSNHHDFARAYGALCWNMADAIPSMDLPHINIIYLPGHDTPAKHLPLEDFDKAREEVIQKVRNAPAKRVDNVVTRLYEYARSLQVHSRVCETMRDEYWTLCLQLWGLFAMASSAALLIMVMSYKLSPKESGWWLLICLIILLLDVGLFFFVRVLLQRQHQEISENLNRAFQKAYREDLALKTKTDDLKALWERVRPRTETLVQTMGLLSLPRLRNKDSLALEEAVRIKLPELRSQIHPDKGPSKSSESAKDQPSADKSAGASG